MDSATDAVIQSTMAKAFEHATVITIAHRLETIMRSDRVIVLEKGQVAEFDTPAALLRRPGSLFRGLVDQMPPKDSKR